MNAPLALAMLALTAADSVRDAEDARVAIIVGSNLGDADDEPLEYAEEDAQRVRDLLVHAGGVSPERALLVTSGGAEAVRRALAQARGRLDELKGRATTTLLFYVSSHADEAALHLAGTRLPLDELRREVEDAPAGLTLVIIDACRTRVRSTPKGGRPGPPVDVTLTRPAQVSGAVWLMAAGEGEAAQELPSLRGSLFTHHLLFGLRGPADVDQDGQVTLAEAYTYTYLHTAGAGTATPQRPAFDLSVRGFGDWAFTRPARLGATLKLSAKLSGPLVVSDQRGALVGELRKPAGEEVSVALRPGWYRVMAPGRGLAQVADVNLSWGGVRTLEPGELTSVPMERARARGGEPIVLRPWRLGVAAGLTTGDGVGQPPQPTVSVSGERQLEAWLVRARLFGGWTSFRGQALTVRQGSLGLGAAVGGQWPVWRLLVGGGVEARVQALWQTLVRDDAEQTTRVFGLAEQVRSGLVLGVAAFGTLALPLGDRLALTAELSVGVDRLPTDAGPQAVPSLTGSLGATASF